MQRNLLDINLEEPAQINVQRETKSYEELLDKCEFTRYQMFMVCYLGFAWLYDGIELVLYGYIFPYIKVEFGLNHLEMGMLSASRFVCCAIGATSLGYFAEKVGTRTMFLFSTGFGCVFSILSSFSTDYWSLAILMGLSGFGFGANVPLVVTYLREFIPSEHRSTTIICMNFWMQIGLAYTAALDWMCAGDWRQFVFLSNIPIFVLLLGTFYSEEKPQHLIRIGKIKRVKNILRNMGLPENDIQTLGTEVINVNEVPVITELFQNHFSDISTHSIIWFGICFASSGALWLPELYETQLNVRTSVFHSVMLGIIVLGTFSYLGIMLLARMYSTRKLLLVIIIASFFLSLIFVCLLETDAKLWLIIFVHICYFLLAGGVWSLIYAVTPGFFPDYIRSFALGICTSWKNVGAITSPIFVGYIMDRTNFYLGFGITCFGWLLASSAGLSFLEEKETYQELEEARLAHE